MVIVGARKADQVSPTDRRVAQTEAPPPIGGGADHRAGTGSRGVSVRQIRRMVLIDIASAFITFTTSPVCGAWTTMPLPMYIPTWCMSPP